MDQVNRGGIGTFNGDMSAFRSWVSYTQGDSTKKINKIHWYVVTCLAFDGN
jgi:hypothetical protein